MTTSGQYIIHHTGLFLVTLLLALSSSSCNKFLDKEPDDRTKIDRVDVVKELLTGGYLDYSYIGCLELRSDNASDKGIGVEDKLTHRQIYTFQDVTTTAQDGTVGFWRNCYGAVAVANQALKSIEELPEGSNSDAVREARGEALIIRAFHMYMLAQFFTLPYDPAANASHLGLPYPMEPENVLLKNYERGTVDELYEQIVKDFEEGFPLLGSNYKAPKFHFTPEAAAAFGARLYRTIGEWDQVIKYARIALGNDIVAKIRKFNGKYTRFTAAEQRSTWSSVTEDCNLLVGVPVSSWRVDNYRSRYGLTNEILDVLGKNFLGASRITTWYGSENSLNFQKFEDYKDYTNSSKTSYYRHTGVVLLSGDEVVLHLAEAYAMKNDFEEANRCLQNVISCWYLGYNPNIESYQVTKEKIVKYFADDKVEYKPFYPLTPDQLAYAKAIAEVRRLVFVQEGLRWLDIRQYKLDVTHKLYTSEKSEEEIVVKGDDPRIAFALPSSVLGYGLEQNPGYASK